MVLTMSGLITFSATALTLTVSLRLIVHRPYPNLLAEFPGPKLAAVTDWYQKYFDLIAKRYGEQFPMKIKRMHEKYGSIMRIAPDELRIVHLEYWQDVYCNSSLPRPVDKQEKLRHHFNLPIAIFNTANAGLHRSGQQATTGLFSRQCLRDTQNKINDIVERTFQCLLEEHTGSHRGLDVSEMFPCIVVEILRCLVAVFLHPYQ